MCGICGFVHSPLPEPSPVLQRMCHTLVHRGPDDEGYYAAAPAHLAMRRLSIIDLDTGQQPMTNENGTLWLVFNGEIYNYRELRGRLQQLGHTFTTQSDSEVIIHAYEQYGPDCLHHFNGMFAIAIWDETRQTLFLARDRIGIKPLYYWCDGQQFVFGSELPALLAHPLVPRQVDCVALDQFLTLEYIPAPRTILAGVAKLPAGTWLTFHDGRLHQETYWDVPEVPVPSDPMACQEQLAELIEDAVRLRLVSDVPLGAFLSGGIDSSTVVAQMSRLMTEPVWTFSMGFADETYNELGDAAAVAAHFATHHHAQVLHPDIADLAVQLIPHLGEPLADFSIFPTYLVSKMAREHVTVVLSGDGGDELFAGYDSYIAQQMDRYYRWLPTSWRQKRIPGLLDWLRPQPAKKGIINKSKRFAEGAALPAEWRHTRWMMFMAASDKARLYQPDLRKQLEGCAAADPLVAAFHQAAGRDPLAQQQYVDLKTYLAENILTKVDRASMAASLEARVPLLDYRIVTLALNLPPHLKLAGGQTKRILRQVMQGQLPHRVLHKPKQGFSIPLKHWLNGPLRPLMLDLLTPETIRRRGYFQPQTVSHWLTEHQSGRVNHSHRLWALMVLELWHSTLNHSPVH